MFEAEWLIENPERQYDSLIDEILAVRKIGDRKSFLDISIDNILDPYLLFGIEKAVKRIVDAIDKGENIVIYGDYDADGLTSAAILKRILYKCGVDAVCFIPDRFDDGYGLNRNSLERIVDNGADLVITTDCGINSLDEVDFMNENGVDVIITDHHVIKGKLPAAAAVVYADKNDEECQFRYLSGAGVALKLADALNRKLDIDDDISDLYALAAIGTIADIVPLVGENRTIAALGISYLNNGGVTGIQAILDAAGRNQAAIDSYTIGFIIGPRLNAAGRMGSADTAFDILIENDLVSARTQAEKLNSLNKKRQEMQREVIEKVEKDIANNRAIADAAVIVSALDGNYKGVVGIAAAKISEKYLKPAIILSVKDGLAEGSGRSAWDFSLIDSLEYCKDVLENYGGHHNAAGLSLQVSEIDELRDLLNQFALESGLNERPVNVLKIDCEATGSDLDLKEVEKLKMLDPVGNGNQSPVLILKDVELSSYRIIGKNRNHLSLEVSREGCLFKCIAFGAAVYEPLLFIGDNYDIAFSAKVNEFRGMRNVQLHIRDMKFNRVNRPACASVIVRIAVNMLKYEKHIKDATFEDLRMLLYNAGMPVSASGAGEILKDYVIDRDFTAGVYNIIRKNYMGCEFSIDSDFGGSDMCRALLAIEILSELGIIKAVPLGMYKYMISGINNNIKRNLRESRVYAFFGKDMASDG